MESIVKPGGYLQYDVADASAAVALAMRLAADGRYRLFRGQRDATWKMETSFARKDAAGQEAARKAIARFADWVRRSPELVPYLSDDDQIIAAAQHHGVAATTFMDFSTNPEVAGFFATDGGEAGDSGAIFMVDPAAVAPMFAHFAKSVPLGFIEVDVRNLWRLQAQEGLFLECGLNLDALYPFDRIVFPQTGNPPAVERRRIYPDRQSHLEQMIHQHLELAARQDCFDDLVTSSGANGISFYTLEAGDDITPVDLAVEPLPEVWWMGPNEAWSEMDIDSIPPTYDLEAASDVDDLKLVVAARRKSVDLLVLTPKASDRSPGLQASLDRLWAGMRPHPFTNAQIARAILALCRIDDGLRLFPCQRGAVPVDAAGYLFIDAIEIDMSLGADVSAPAFVSGERLNGALTPAGRELLGLAQDRSGRGLMAALVPFEGQTMRLFKGPEFAEIFVDEIVPWQVAMNRFPVAFSPSHITRLGLR